MSADEHGAASTRAAAGFTLIEMLVALAIFSLAALALLRLEGATLASTTRIADQAVGETVARNLTVALLTDPRAPAIGEDHGLVTNAGRSWRWTRITRRTDDSRIVRIDLSVADEAGRRMAGMTLVRPIE